MLEREVLINGNVYHFHDLKELDVFVGNHIIARVDSYNENQEETVSTWHEILYKDGISKFEAEQIVWALPEFDKYVDNEAMLENVLEILTDDQAILVPDAFKEWRAGVDYSVNDRCRDGTLYKCVQAHTSQEGWEPHATPALWVAIAEPGTIPEWVQPAGAHDAYNTGDHVMHNGSEWVSTMDANVYEPGVYGWDEVEG